MSLAGFGVRNPVLANLLAAATLIFGIIFGLGLRREFFPEIRPSLVSVSAPYPGAAPEEVEASLAIKIEDAVADLRDIKEISTSVQEGLALVTIEYEDGVDIDDKVAEVKRKVDALQDLPQDADRIIVEKIEPNIPTIVLSVAGDADERDLKRTIRLLRDDLKSLEGMGDIAISGLRVDEIRVEVDPRAVLEHRLSLPAVSSLIDRAMRELPGGTVRTPTQNTSIRTVAVQERAARVREIVVGFDPGGRVVRLGDIADVSDTFADVDTRARLNGKPAASLTVFKVGEQDAVDMAAMVKAYAAGLRGEEITLTNRERLSGPKDPPSERIRAYRLGLDRAEQTPIQGEVIVTTDLARFIVGRFELLTRNAVSGGILVFITLVLLLNWRSSFWVGVGLIVAIAGTLVAMRLLGVTLNLLTMFGLIIVVGMLVDDAIVVAENITRRHEQGEEARTAAIEGTRQVTWPVVATVTTTVAAFLPLALIEGRMGDFLKWLPAVVGIALAVSLVEALFVLPSHMAHTLRGVDRRRSRGAQSRLERLEHRFDDARDRVVQGMLIPGYAGLLRRLIRRRYLVAASILAVMIASFGMVAGGRLPFIFFEVSDDETINGNLRMAIGTPVERTDEVVRRVEQAALGMPEVKSVFASVGAQGDVNGELPEVEQPHLGQVFIELVPVEERDRTSKQIVDAIRRQVGSPPGLKSLRLEGVSGGPSGAAITLVATGPDGSALEAVIRRVEQMLREYDGLYGINNDSDAGQRELRISLLDGASDLGFTVTDIAQQLRAAVVGLEAYTFAGNRESVDIRVTYPPAVRRSLAAIEELHVLSPSGEPVPLTEICRLDERTSFATIRRLDRQRAITVNADATAATNPEQVMGDLRPRLAGLAAEFPGVRILERGRQKDMKDSFGTLPLGMGVAMSLIYIVLTWLFKSYVQPLIVMTAIPFATIGMIWGHLIMGFNMTFLSLIGFVALAGVVVNDSLIFMEFYNERRRDGMSVHDAVIDAGRNRVRAILLTTITTVLGLSPLMLEQSLQARFLIPMAITISFGLMSATVVILILLPCLLLMLDDAKRLLAAMWTGKPAGLMIPVDERPATILVDDTTPNGAITRAQGARATGTRKPATDTQAE
ncbi:MAG: efflux RND transporter permease subunit [Phycisphaeraceae bacterium]|nr:efflux RND transporter permease subunit [Phycisphaeraceae bacterium]